MNTTPNPSTTQEHMVELRRSIAAHLTGALINLAAFCVLIGLWHAASPYISAGPLPDAAKHTIRLIVWGAIAVAAVGASAALCILVSKKIELRGLRS